MHSRRSQLQSSPRTLARVLLRHEHSRGSLFAGADEDESEIEVTPRPGTARRMAVAERRASDGLEGHAEELRSVVEGVRVDFDSTLAGLRDWRLQHDADAARARERYAAEEAAAAALAALRATALRGLPVAVDAVGEELDQARVQRVRAMLDHKAPESRSGSRASAAASAAEESSLVVSVVEVKLALMAAVPLGLDAVDTDLVRRLERELMAKYGMAPKDGVSDGTGDRSSREAAALKVRLGKYAAGLDSVLDLSEWAD
jgi:hypothetical protein